MTHSLQLPEENSGQKPVALDALTGIRFIAAVMVFLFHYGARFASRSGVPAPIVRFLLHGYLGVSLFYILSGFILTYSYSGQVTKRSWKRKFFFARFARVYPVYILALLLALPVMKSGLEPHQIARVLTLTQSWGLPASEEG